LLVPKNSSPSAKFAGRLRSVVTARPWLTALVAALAVAGGAATVLFAGGSAATGAATKVSTSLVSVATGTVRAAVSTTGTFAPADEEDVSFASSAEITSVQVAVGDRVAAGQVLGTIDATSLRAASAQARVALAEAKATLASAEDSTSSTSAQLAADRAGVTSATASVSSARTALSGATLRSPIAGTVAAVNIAVGDQSGGSSGSGATSGGTSGGSTSGGSTAGGSVAGSSTTGGSTTGSTSSSSSDFVVVGMKKWTVSATVDDTQVGLIAQGDQVQVSTDNVTGTVFGTVSSVSVLSSSSSGSASYPVEIAVTGSPAGLHDGASATASIIYKQVTDVLTVPTTAIHRDADGTYVELAVDGAQKRTAVRTGLSSGGTTQITSGLRSGQQVYVQVVVPTTTGTGTNRQSGTFRNGGEFPGGGQLPGGFQGGGNAPGAGFGGTGQ
jgi:macrolide-specific efflux system membrane fusion protein